MDARQGIAKEEAVSEYYISKTMKALLADPSDLQPIRVQPILGGDGHLLYNVLSPSEVKCVPLCGALRSADRHPGTTLPSVSEWASRN